jgi:2-keto-4-pentenoate hydratase/2-oxohepta-3-ene-1,7-dioic acid hydratase in catechol pathway
MPYNGLVRFDMPRQHGGITEETKAMITRRTLIKSAGAGAAGAAVGLGTPAQAQEKRVAAKYNGPFEMPKSVTLLSIANADGTETLGIKTGDAVIDVRKASQLLNLPAAHTLDQLLQEGSASQLKTLSDAVNGSAQAKEAVVPEASITYGRLFMNPGKIICVGLNYKRHAAEVGMPIPKQPILFNKYNNSLAAHNCTISLPPREISYKFDYETELLIVIGKKARNVSEADAPNYIAGFCTSQDFSARDLQLETGGQWMIGKTLDNFAPIGPYFVSSDLVGDPHKLKLETYVNGEVRQSWSTDDFIFNTYQVVSFISKHWALEPGDIIFTGTPHGVIVGMPKDKQVWLKAGDQIESRIEKLGTLKFKLV